MFDFKEIYGEHEEVVKDNGVKIEHIGYRSQDKNGVTCVFGVLCNHMGNKLKKEMMVWLASYDLYIVYQMPPGRLFEYPALRFCQYLTQEKGVSKLLYLHTKGASNPNKGQEYVRACWKHEFGDSGRCEGYIAPLNTEKPAVTCPYEGRGGMTWFNGFFANKAAFNAIPTIEPNDDRYFYEGLFSKKPIKIIPILGGGLINSKVMARVESFARNVCGFTDQKDIKQLIDVPKTYYRKHFYGLA